MVDQAVGDERGRHEIGGGPQGLQLGGGFAAHGGDLEAGGPPGQAAALALQACLHRLHAVGAGHNQPVEVFEVGQGVIKGAPVVRWADHQGRQVKHLGPGLFEQVAGRPQLLFRPGDGDAATREGALGSVGTCRRGRRQGLVVGVPGGAGRVAGGVAGVVQA